jgi:hypothetical protein
MEIVSKTLMRTMEGGFLLGFQLGDGSIGSLMISYLLFADDNILFYDTTVEHLLYIRAVLLCFETVSGLEREKLF